MHFEKSLVVFETPLDKCQEFRKRCNIREIDLQDPNNDKWTPSDNIRLLSHISGTSLWAPKVCGCNVSQAIEYEQISYW